MLCFEFNSFYKLLCPFRSVFVLIHFNSCRKWNSLFSCFKVVFHAIEIILFVVCFQLNCISNFFQKLAYCRLFRWNANSMCWGKVLDYLPFQQKKIYPKKKKYCKLLSSPSQSEVCIFPIFLCENKTINACAVARACEIKLHFERGHTNIESNDESTKCFCERSQRMFAKKIEKERKKSVQIRVVNVSWHSKNAHVINVYLQFNLIISKTKKKKKKKKKIDNEWHRKKSI